MSASKLGTLNISQAVVSLEISDGGTAPVHNASFSVAPVMAINIVY